MPARATDELRTTFVRRLDRLRFELRMSQLEFAKLTGIPQPTIWCYLSGSRTPSIGNLCRLADRLGVSVDYLLGRTSSRRRNHYACSHN